MPFARRKPVRESLSLFIGRLSGRSSRFRECAIRGRGERHVRAGSAEVGDTSGADDAVDGNVMRFRGHLVEQFVVVDDGEDVRPRSQRCERSVVVPAAPAESHAASIDRGGGHEDELGLRERGGPERPTDGLGDTERARSLGRTVRVHPVERSVGRGNGQQHADALAAASARSARVPGSSADER